MDTTIIVLPMWYGSSPLSCYLSELLHYFSMAIENSELKLAGTCWRLRTRKFILISLFEKKEGMEAIKLPVERNCRIPYRRTRVAVSVSPYRCFVAARSLGGLACSDRRGGIVVAGAAHSLCSFGAAKLFDGMLRRLNDGANTEKTMASGEDRIAALPDELLQYLMSFLPSRDAVQTCVLAKRWRTLWKSVPALRVIGPHSYNGVGSDTFVNELLRLRDPTPLDLCDIRCPDDVEMDDDFKFWYEELVYTGWTYEAFQYMEPWLRYALSCQVQVLRVSCPWWVSDLTLISSSSHLKRLELYRMTLYECPLDFSSCKVLEVFEMVDCDNNGDIILSQSLQHLNIHGGDFRMDGCVRISTPNLISLGLSPSSGLIPLLDSMPSLVTAAVTLGEVCPEVCYCDNPSCEVEGCNPIPAVLKGLSGATNLKLTISEPRRLSAFRKDLTCRPMFSKLKTLLLNKWSVGDDFTGLVYFLQHSPILETLTLQLDLETSEEYHLSETGERYNSSEQSLLAEHLKVVKIIRGTQEDVIVDRILKILCTHGVPSERIEIE